MRCCLRLLFLWLDGIVPSPISSSSVNDPLKTALVAMLNGRKS